MTNKEGAVAAQEVVYTQTNEQDEAVLVASLKDDKLHIMFDPACHALRLSSTGKSVLLATGSFEVDTKEHGTVKVQCNVSRRLKNGADVAKYEAIIIAGAEKQSEAGTTSESLENNSILQRAAAIKAGSAQS